MSILSDFPTPTLNFQPALHKTPEQLLSHMKALGITFDRGSESDEIASYVDQFGNLQLAPANYPRPNFVDGINYGFLVEGLRIQLFLNSETLSTQGVTATADEYTVSFFGTGTITFSGAYSGSLVGTGEKERVEITFTPTAGTVTCTVSGNVKYANFEKGAFATSWIKSEGSTVTRSADDAIIEGQAFLDFYNYGEGTFIVEAISFQEESNGASIISSNQGNHGVFFRNNIPRIVLGNYNAGDGNKNFPEGTTVNDFIKAGAVLYPDGVEKFHTLGSIVTNDNEGFSNYESLLVGASIHPSSIGALNGHVKSIVYFPKALTDAQLEAFTRNL
ncbi:MAG: hypothetical protein ABJR05_14115 [Balneola sp.]